VLNIVRKKKKKSPSPPPQKKNNLVVFSGLEEDDSRKKQKQKSRDTVPLNSIQKLPRQEIFLFLFANSIEKGQEKKKKR
jgi:hypothetical protein